MQNIAVNVKNGNEIVKFCAYYRLRKWGDKKFDHRKYAQKSAVLIAYIYK